MIEKMILNGTLVIYLTAILFIPYKKADKASFIFFMSQFFTWILGLSVVELGWLEYPVREFAEVNKTSLLFEYVVFPITTIFFILHYPRKKTLKIRSGYYFTIISFFTIIEYLLEKYTMVIEYHSWDWYWTWISLFSLFYIEMVIYKWFFKLKQVFSI
ncbi:hypothetical protein JOC75_000543 [Metabacillus crassostreae]|uniref:CBO0543 family protein n=1 Tax=Metabacillus crassostreae TaxID=929098 RepID=UPI00195E99A9|nr:CBO0543 family protein [Metabacillus crassostreae]MBM7602573.1 hypothetical protein [Metabacillus crassostreae]